MKRPNEPPKRWIILSQPSVLRQFTLRWFEDPPLRRTITAELNKGEACNSLARAVVFHRLSRTRDRGLENQQTRAAARTLSPPRSYYLTAAISVAPLKKCAVAERRSIRRCWPACRGRVGTV
nr:transposase [Sphingomonas sp. PAMC 26605]